MSGPDDTSETGDDDAVEALKAFGFSAYEAETLIALQKLGVGSARDVHEVSGVPRSQVYGAAESLAESGFVDVQQTNPQVYRPVTVEEIGDRLRSRFESRYELVADHLSDLAARRRTTNEHRQDVWRIEGAAIVDSRAVSLLETADSEVVYVLSEGTLVSANQESTIRSLVDDGVDVTLITGSDAAEARFEEMGVDVIVPTVEGASMPIGRIVLVDDAGLLLSVRGHEETAIWSRDTMFARTLSDLIRQWLATAVAEFSE